MKPKNNLRLGDLMKINTLQSYVPKYHSVRQMNETEMLVVKNALDQHKKYPNVAHEEALNNLVDILRERLNIHEPIASPEYFLRTLLNDYIVLTR
jgi:hypothetical protein